MEKDLRKKLGIDDWLELVKEDRNCHGAYISFGQYMYLLEKENQELKKQLEECSAVADTNSELADYYKEVIDKAIEYISELDDNTDDTTCYDIDKDTRDYILSILKEVK